MTKKQILHALATISPLLDIADHKWCVFGSAALVLNDVTGIEAHDVDILLSANGLRRLITLIPQAMLCDEDKPGGRFRSLHAHICSDGIEIDLSGNLEIMHDGGWMPVRVEQPCVASGIHYASLRDCARLLMLFGRPKDMARLSLLMEWRARNGMPDR